MGIERDETSDCTNPKIDVTCKISSVLTDPYILEFIIYERVTSAPALVQVYPPSGRETVDLNDCPVGHRLSTGKYVAEWTVPSAEPIGIHEVHWFYKETASHPEKTEAFEFVVTLPAALTPPTDLYVTVQDIRDEGITVAELSDDRALFLTTGWQKWFEARVGQWFTPKDLELEFDGNGSRVLWLPVPIIDVTALYINDDFTNAVDTDNYTVYNRYVPDDDRKNPRIKLKRSTTDIFSAASGYKFVAGDLNQKVVGSFGYIEEDGSVPYGVWRAIIQLVVTTMEVLSDGDIDAMRSGRVIEEVTDRHRIEFSSLWDDIQQWSPTGLTDVDNALAMYRKPAYVGTPRRFQL